MSKVTTSRVSRSLLAAGLLMFSPLLRAVGDTSVVLGSNGCYSLRVSDYVFDSLCYDTYEEARDALRYLEAREAVRWQDVTAPARGEVLF
jgi:hypothetical protein